MRLCFVKILVFVLLLSSCSFNSDKSKEEETTGNNLPSQADKLLPEEIVVPEEKNEIYKIKVDDEGQVVYYSNGNGYRYGPSIIKYKDGSMDMWISAPGNSGSQWDWITYMHSSDGLTWSREKIVLKPTPGSRDQCSVCDPGVIYFNDYYYLAYTATDYYEGRGTNNSAFVARSKNPDGPFEKWNGEGWGGNPQPIIEYEDDPKGWGKGEISFVIKDEELYIYHTCFDIIGGSTRLAKADLSDDWPLTISGDEVVCGVTDQDSLDIVYAEDLGIFLGFAISQRMTDRSRLVMYESKDGTDFVVADNAKGEMKEFAHNVGISKDQNGFINTEEKIVIGYGFGKQWGDWSLIVQETKVLKED